MRIRQLLFSQVLYNRRLKKLAARFLASPLINKNHLYNSLYCQFMSRKMTQFVASPTHVMIENTNICNANCVFCPHQAMRRKAGVMGRQLFKKIINECSALKIDYVTVHGFGEPLLDKDFFDKVVYAKQKGIPKVTTNTNGMYLNEGNIERVFETGLDEIFISFDAATAETYSKIRPGLDFNTVERNILMLAKEKKRRKSKKPVINLSFVESENNFQETEGYLKKWRRQADNISVSFLHNWAGGRGVEKPLGETRRDPCRLIWTDMVISWNGDVPICCNDYENKVILGNVENQSIEEIWGGERLKKLREYHRRGEFEKISVCRDCDYNYHYRSSWWGV